MRYGLFTVCGVVEIEGKVLFVRHTYGFAKDKILCPGGYVKENELPTQAIEREILEETGVVVRARSILSVQFMVDQWCVVFDCEYISGTPRSDGHENSEVTLLPPQDAVVRDDITNMSRELMKIYLKEPRTTLPKNPFVQRTFTDTNYALFG